MKLLAYQKMHPKMKSKKYRKLSLQHHPDRGGNEETFKKLSEAYEQIGDPENRQRYDMEQNNPFLGEEGWNAIWKRPPI